MTAFDDMRDALYGDANLAVAVAYQPLGASAVTLSALLSLGDQAPEIPGLGRRVTPARVIRVRVSEAEAAGITPQADDRVTIGGETFRVLSTPRREDVRRAEWTLDLG